MKNTPRVWGQRPHAGGGGNTPANIRGFQNRSGGFPKKTGSAEVGSGKPVVTTVFLGDPRFWDARGSNSVDDESQRARGRGGTKPTRRTRNADAGARGGTRAPSPRAKPRYTNQRRETEVPTQQSNKTRGSAERHDQNNDGRSAGTRGTTEPRWSHRSASHGRACSMQGAGGFPLNERG